MKGVDLTAPVEAAARAAFDKVRNDTLSILPPTAASRLAEWEQIGPVQQNVWRTQVLPLVQAAVEAVPDGRWAAWEEGLASADYSFEDGDVYATCDNPYPSPLDAEVV